MFLATVKIYQYDLIVSFVALLIFFFVILVTLITIIGCTE